jgi:hypothetical protein
MGSPEGPVLKGLRSKAVRDTGSDQVHHKVANMGLSVISGIGRADFLVSLSPFHLIFYGQLLI